MRSPRILHVLAEMAAGGAERVALRLCEGAIQSGYRAAICADTGPLDSEATTLGAGRYFVQDSGWSPLRGLLNVWRLARVIRAFEPDVVHAHNERMCLTAALALVVARRAPALLATAHHDAPKRNSLSALMFRSSPSIVAVTDSIREALIRGGVPAANVVVIPNGVQAAVPVSDPAMTGERMTVVFAGRLASVKNPVRFVQAARAVSAMGHDARFVVLGDGPEMERVRRATGEARGVDVDLLGHRTDAAQWIAAADVLVISSDREGLPMVALDAFAAKTAVVSTPVAGLVELAAAGAAHVARDFSADGLASAIAAVLADTSLRGRLIDAGAHIHRERYRGDLMISRYLDLYARRMSEMT